MNLARDPVMVPPFYTRLMARRRLLLLVGLAVLSLLLIADVLIGPALFGIDEVIIALFNPASVDQAIRVIVWSIRLPMTLMALFVGAALGIAGAVMQAILANPLASPYTLGFSAAAGFGAATAIITGVTLPLLPWLTVPAAALVSATLASALVYGIARLRGANAEIMILAGITTLFLFQSLQSMVQFLAAPEILQAIVFWLFGSLLKANWHNLAITAGLFSICILLLLPELWRLTALRMGDERAAAIGVDVERLRIKAFAYVALLTAAAVAFVGTIGFIGLVAPHIARMLVGDDQRVLIPMAAIVGGFVMVAASILSKILVPGSVVPIGIVTAIIGVPFMMSLILRRHRGL